MTVIAVEGIVGAGKSHFVQFLAEQLFSSTQCVRIMEEPVDARLLKDFYKSPARYAFEMQLKMLASRAYAHSFSAFGSLSPQDPIYILDRSMVGDRVFAEQHYLSGNISRRQWDIYEQLYRHLAVMAPAPDVLVYLECPTDEALRRIEKRGRESEQHEPLPCEHCLSLTPPVRVTTVLNVEGRELLCMRCGKPRDGKGEGGVTREYLAMLEDGYARLLLQIERHEHHWARGVRGLLHVPWQGPAPWSTNAATDALAQVRRALKLEEVTQP